MLWIDDHLVVNHDGPHGAVPKDGEVELAAGDHTLRVAHFESGGEEHLELQWRLPGAETDQFTLIPAAILRHDHLVSRETSPGDKRIIAPLRRGLPGDGTPVAGMHPSLNGTQGLLILDRSKEFDLNRYWPSLHRSGQDLHPTDSFVGWLARDEEQAGYGAVIEHHKSPYLEQLIVVAPMNCEYTYTHSSIVRRSNTEVESKRVFTDHVSKRPQGCVFRFGHISSNFELSGKMAFEMLAVRAMTKGFEIEFTKPLEPRCGWDPETYYVEQWPYDLNRWDLPARDGVRYPVKSASVSADRKRVFLEIPDLKESHVVYIRLLPPCYSEDGERPWSTEAWYTLNVIPENRMGEVRKPPPAEPQNFLTAEEQAAGWKLLFDGKTTAGWRGYRKDDMPDGWQVRDGCLVRVGPGGDIITEDEFDNFELKIEWRICAAGNSGIFYRVNEDFDWPFFTGPEFQVLDNAEHADGRSPLTSAGSNYALYAPVRDVTAPVGFFNQVRIVCNGAHVEHWLNGVKIVEYELWSDEWKELVAGSKFAAWPEYGLMKTGHIVLQDHGDQVWYRNIKIRALVDE
jgi:hypothetical protein